MGGQHSTPVPKDTDFLVEHEPHAVPLSTKKIPMMELSFRLQKNSWKTGAAVEGLAIEVVPLRENKRCLVKDGVGTVLAVLQVQKHKEVQICSFSPNNQNKSIGDYSGKPIYEHALVTEREDRYRHSLVVEGTRYQMERCGSKSGPKDLAILRDGVVCAYVTEEPQKMRGCRIGPGVDPVLMVAFLVCSDKLRSMLEEMLTQKSGMPSYKLSRITQH